jgi:hypothetical protein
MKRLPLAVLALMLPGALAAQTGSQLERGELPASQGPQTIEEYIPEGESVERWTRMVTVQHFGPRVTQGQNPIDFMERMRGLLANSCPGAEFDYLRLFSLRLFSVEGVPAASMRSDCPLNSVTRQPETTFFLALGRDTNLDIVQVAFRHLPEAGEVAWAENYLETVHLCEENCR